MFKIYKTRVEFISQENSEKQKIGFQKDLMKFLKERPQWMGKMEDYID